MEEADKNFILASWLNNARYSRMTSRIPSDIYFKWHQRVIERIWDRAGSITSIAALKEDPSIILGYLCYEELVTEPVIHFCYVKKPFRKEGIARSLFKRAEIDFKKRALFTHYTHEMDVICEKYPELIYCPYSL